MIRFAVQASTTLLSVFAASSIASAEVPMDEMTRYLANAQAIVDQLQSDGPDSTLVADAVTEMLELAKPVLIAFGERHTQCIAQLAKVVELYPEIDQWSAPDIRRNIEAAGSLPRASGCYPARDVIAHPAIVRAFARLGLQTSDRQGLLAEINEGIEHMQEIQQQLTSGQ